MKLFYVIVVIGFMTLNATTLTIQTTNDNYCFNLGDIAQISFDGTFTDEDIENISSNPSIFNLINYPNPFTPNNQRSIRETNIKFSLKNSGKTSVDIFNLKGQKVVKKPKNIYSDKFPKLACNSCYAAQNCPDFEADMVCAYNKMFKRFDSRRMSDVIEAMQGMANLNLERMQRLMMFEVLDGGMLDGNLTALIDQNMRLLMGMKNLYDKSGDEVLRQTKTFKADGTVQETTELQNPQSGGILEKLFSSNLKPKEAEKSEDIKKEEAIDIDVILVED